MGTPQGGDIFNGNGKIQTPLHRPRLGFFPKSVNAALNGLALGAHVGAVIFVSTGGENASYAAYGVPGNAGDLSARLAFFIEEANGFVVNKELLTQDVTP